MMTFTIDFSKHTVLIIDDNPTNLGVIADYLDEYDFEIITARRGEEGIERAIYAQPDIILLDIMMPGIDGFETCSQLKANELTTHIPIIFMTALSGEADKVRGFDVGAVDYVTKPLQQREVVARLHTHLSIQTQAKQLQEQAQELQALNRSKDKFFSIVAHDLRGPFMPMLGNAELMHEMAEDLPRESLKDMSRDIYVSGQRIMDLLENLLQWSRIQLGSMKYDPELITLQQVVIKNIDLLTANAKEKNIKLINQIDDELTVYADMNMLHTIVRNVTNNAIKFTPVDGQITVSAYLNKQQIRIAVTDTGVGISPEDKEKLFKIDVHHSTFGTARETGTGLGLIMCKEMVEINGGEIWLESELGKGTTVNFTIPIKAT